MKKKIIDKKYEFEECEFCNKHRFVYLFEASSFDNPSKRFSVYKCVNCNIARTFPVLTEAAINPYYQESYYGAWNKKFNPLIENVINYINRMRAEKIHKLANRNIDKDDYRMLRVLDVGCGRGLLLKELNKLNFECYGVERPGYKFESDLVNMNLFTQDLKTIKFQDNWFDIVIMWHSLEHIMNSTSLVEEVQRILKPGGMFIVSVPNFGGFQSKLFQSMWFHLDLPRHTHHFSRNNLEKYLLNCGFSSFSISTYSFEQSVYGFIQSSLNILFPSNLSNQLYSLLKVGGQSSKSPKIFFWLPIIFILFPIAFFEFLISGLFHQGAVLNICVYKD
jgi:2-polyprenyl-3-methyl-5-hydroxy-6-metoxy-1,4-benzoquinol methylase